MITSRCLYRQSMEQMQEQMEASACGLAIKREEEVEKQYSEEFVCAHATGTQNDLESTEDRVKRIMILKFQAALIHGAFMKTNLKII